LNNSRKVSSYYMAIQMTPFASSIFVAITTKLLIIDEANK